jgi:hypothetical protein
MTTKRHALRVIKGGYAPADYSTAAALRKRHKVGDLVFAEFRKPRSPGFHRLAHALGGVLAENLDAFAHLDAHTVLKRLQVEGDIACDTIPMSIPGVGPVEYRIPRSLSFESMDEDEFRDVIQSMCRYVSKRYWPSSTPDEIERMAELWIQEAA